MPLVALTVWQVCVCLFLSFVWSDKAGEQTTHTCPPVSATKGYTHFCNKVLNSVTKVRQCIIALLPKIITLNIIRMKFVYFVKYFTIFKKINKNNKIIYNLN